MYIDEAQVWMSPPSGIWVVMGGEGFYVTETPNDDPTRWVLLVQPASVTLQF